MDVRDAARRKERGERLRASSEVFEVAIDSCAHVWQAGRLKRRSIEIRTCFIVGDPNGRTAPLSRLIRPRGIAWQVYLLALFEAQCSRTGGSAVLANKRPLVPSRPGEVAWSNLVLPEMREALIDQSKVERQLKTALTALEKVDLVVLPERPRARNRCQGFRLLHESAESTRVTPVMYTVPDRNEPRIALPVDFFTKGWVHVLSPAETAVYLMLRHLKLKYPREHDLKGVYAAEAVREGVYGIRRDTYERHRELAAYGLIQLIPDPSRRPDGKIRGYRAGEDGSPLNHRFQVLPDSALRRNALEVVASSSVRANASMQ
ncbi:hypothetical protein SAMN04489712_14320 [Thermomonospora echinospora]|uniref:Uncharacterized protein n=1 Tax=Thermomonospora echinospora TaxID=1992 RepID=A0A1H6E8J2_9ACTN|nr:hypothetical protein [Thermomonospora echinospora]SEG94138.1 hypothetical protein SAMN04489712_14320 [Thermomonospora echinospora]